MVLVGGPVPGAGRKVKLMVAPAVEEVVLVVVVLGWPGPGRKAKLAKKLFAVVLLALNIEEAKITLTGRHFHRAEEGKASGA